jgi:hypothetical protein
MPATEDSVLTSLNELRRLRKERQKKGHPGRGASGRSRKPVVAAHDPMDDEVTPPPRTDLMPAAKGARHGGQMAHAPLTKQAPAPAPNLMMPPAATWDNSVAPATLVQMAKPSSSAKPAIIVAVLLLAVAGGGYVKLQNDTKALIAAKDAEIRRVVDDARAQVVEATAKAERQAQVKIKACENKMEAAATPAPSPAASAVAVAPTPSAKSSSASSSSSSYASSSSSKRSRHKEKASSGGGRRASASSTAAAPAPEPSAVPNLPRKKKLDNDPLAGIKI